ncbi:MAG: hypothetical protein ACREIC_05470, partial [Limisphaerales bacterium]
MPAPDPAHHSQAAKRCPTCDTELSAGVLGGQCPVCMARIVEGSNGGHDAAATGLSREDDRGNSGGHGEVSAGPGRYFGDYELLG